MKNIAIPMSTSKTQHYLNQAYVSYITGVRELRAIPVYPEMGTGFVENMCDGLVLPGGIDIDPVYYDIDNDSSFSVDPAKDQFERGLLHKFRQANKPVFGICRGLQLIIMEFLEEYNEFTEFFDFVLHIRSHQQTADVDTERTIKTHSVQYMPEVLYGKPSKGAQRMYVNSMHHQCLQGSLDTDTDKIITRINSVDERITFRIGAYTERGIGEKETGYIVEGFSIDGWGGRIVAVQWHPEELKDFDLLKNIFLPHKKKPVLTKKQGQ